ncbi:MAG: mechanosensitive ion channel family protein [Spirochaetae bacterium HGW-Spirochaetae-9]|nr:MAG: mechanosensitive ion channel family protein [Spirochaetae bacterium HGW-Spirochaetae-9]
MNTDMIPDFLTSLADDLTKPESWKKALGVGLALVLILVISRVLQIIVAKTLRKTMPEPRALMIKKAIRYLGYVIAATTLMKAFGLDLSALLGAAGIAGIAIGFAAQTSISNLISGLFLISEKPFQIGDSIQVGDITGIVMSVDLLSVKLQTFDNRFVRIPNETIIKTNVINISRFPIRRLDVWVSVAYSSDLEKVKDLLKDIAAKNIHVLDNPAPLIFFDKFDASGINILFGLWFEISKLLDVKNSIIIDIHKRFAAEGIEIPFPKMDVILRENGS